MIVLAFETVKDKLELIVVEINKDQPDEKKQSLFIQNAGIVESQPLSLVFGRDSGRRRSGRAS